MLKDLPHNTRLTLLLEPYSSVLACILTFYAALYMQANGLDARQIGLITTLIAHFGLSDSMRFLYGFAFVSMTLMFFFRHRLLTETAAGIELSRHHADLSLVESLRHHLQVVFENLANPEFRKLALTWVLFSFAQTMGFVFTLYYNVLKLTPGQLSLLPPLSLEMQRQEQAMNNEKQVGLNVI
jgi:hypothetical protein